MVERVAMETDPELANYILKGVLNNIIFNAKNEAKIDTQKLLNGVKSFFEKIR